MPVPHWCEKLDSTGEQWVVKRSPGEDQEGAQQRERRATTYRAATARSPGCCSRCRYLDSSTALPGLVGEGSTCFLTCGWSDTAALPTALQQCSGQESGLLHNSESQRPAQSEQSLRDCGPPRLLNLAWGCEVSTTPTSGCGMQSCD
ncbi:hypothetical protein AOLI_G00300570 [Acnodon oligacanthus]